MGVFTLVQPGIDCPTNLLRGLVCLQLLRHPVPDQLTLIVMNGSHEVSDGRFLTPPKLVEKDFSYRTVE
jgi:hypothetical protein